LLLFDIVFIFIVVRVRWNRITTKKKGNITLTENIS